MTRFSLGDWKEDSVGVFVDGQQVARLVNTGWPGQSQLPMDLLNLIRHGTPTVPDELQTFDVTFAVCVDAVDAETAVEDARKLVSNPTWKASKVVQLSNQTYRIALVKEGSLRTGDWDIVETFVAADDDAANAYAEEHWGDRDWYVLNAHGDNINAW